MELEFRRQILKLMLVEKAIDGYLSSIPLEICNAVSNTGKQIALLLNRSFLRAMCT